MVRENTEGFYADRNMFMGNGEFMPTPDVALAVRKITRKGSTRIAETAFKLAMSGRARRSPSCTRPTCCAMSDGLFLECTRAVAANYPQVECEEQIMDAMAALLVRDASRFDVIVATNAFGDILSDEASEISGSLGLAASINAGDEHALAQAQHGSAPDIAGQDRANPASLIGSVAMLLAWLGERRSDPTSSTKAADLIERALDTDRSPSPNGAPPISAARSAPRRSASGWRRSSAGHEIAVWDRAGTRTRGSALKRQRPKGSRRWPSSCSAAPIPTSRSRSGIESGVDSLRTVRGLSDQPALPALRPAAPRHRGRRLPDR